MPNDGLVWECRGRQFDCLAGPLIMGVLNVTPDSFSDGGRYFGSETAIARGLQMAAEGADILDIGGESSRPGAEPVPLEEELRRVVPVVRGLVGRVPCAISIDTTKAPVARAALEAGAHIVNDISALRGDPDMADVVREFGAGVVLMHMQGTPRTMQDNPTYSDPVREIREFLSERLAFIESGGIPRNRAVVDPGIGFGKTLAHNLAILRDLPAFAELGRPILLGVSRKRFLGMLTGREVGDRLLPSVVTLAYALTRGAHIFRVHDVKESCEAANLVATLLRGYERRR